MKRHLLSVDCVAFNAAMAALLKASRPQEALQLMQGMAQLGVQGSVVSYGTAMRASNELGRWEERF